MESSDTKTDNAKSETSMASSSEQSVAEHGSGERSDTKLCEDMNYDYEELCSRPYITPDSGIPENFLLLSHSFGYDCGRRANLQLLDERTVAFIAGNLVVLLDVMTKEQRYLRSCSGGGIGTIMAHPTKRYFAVAEKGNLPYIIVYEYPSLQPYRILRGGTGLTYSCVDFNRDGTLLVSVGGAPDYMLTLWDWGREQALLQTKAYTEDVYRVSFSAANPEQLTTSGSGHIMFWKMDMKMTALKLQGLLGKFEKTALTDIEAYVELPDGKVVSGSEWGNLLLWDGGFIKVEICRKGGGACHAGSIRQLVLDEVKLISVGADRVIRTWDFEIIDIADCDDDGGVFEMEPMTEMVVGRNVSLSSMVKSSLPDSGLWFAQDSNGAIWKLDLSFSYNSQDPECLCSFHAGAIQGIDVSTVSHLMATTALDGYVRVYDFLSKNELTTSHFQQGGTTLTWAPFTVDQRGALLVTGFQDGGIRMFEIFRTRSPHAVAGNRPGVNAQLRLQQAFKPHNAPVTSIAYERNGEILATGSTDGTVFFFDVRKKYDPIGFIKVPGPVQGLEWSPQSHSQSTLLVLCLSGHVVEVEVPDSEAQDTSQTYQLSGLTTRAFGFTSIRSRLQDRQPNEGEAREKKEREEKPSPLFTPDKTSPLYCGFYSQSGQFWLSMGGHDAGFLYHCKFSDRQDVDPSQRHDEPFDFLPIHNSSTDPILSITFRLLMLCGMHSGTIRVYPLLPGDHSLTTMEAYWALSAHDNQYGHLRHVRFSHEGDFVLTAGEDGNIFSFTFHPAEGRQRALPSQRADVPSPREGLELEGVVDVDYSIASLEVAKQEQIWHQAELVRAAKQKKLSELKSQLRQQLNNGQSFPGEVQLTEQELDRQLLQEVVRLKEQKVMEVRQELEVEARHHRLALNTLRERFRGALESQPVTVVAIRSNHRVTTYRPLPQAERTVHLLRQPAEASWPGGGAGLESGDSEAQLGKGSKSKEEGDDEAVLTPQPSNLRAHPKSIKLAGPEAEKHRRDLKKAKQALAKIEQRKKEWAQLHAEKPDENYEDPADVLAIRHATENTGEFRLKSDKAFTVPEHLRVNADTKIAEMVALEEQMHEKKSEMNGLILALRDAKVRLVSQLRSQANQLQLVQRGLAPHERLPPPALPGLLPEETPEKKLQPSRATLERYQALRSKRVAEEQSEEEMRRTLLEQLELWQEEEEEESREEESREEVPVAGGANVTAPSGQLEELVKEEEQVRLVYQQDCLLQQMEASALHFDAELCLLRHQKIALDCRMKLADLRHRTLFQEYLLAKDYEEQERSRWARLDALQQENRDVRLGLKECVEQLEIRRRSAAKLQERESTVMETFKELLGESHKFVDILTRVFKHRMRGGEEKEEDSDVEDSDSEEDVDISVCPPNCDAELFKQALQLRQRRLDLNTQLDEQNQRVRTLEEKHKALLKKEKHVQVNMKSAEDDLELLSREKHQRLNELDVVVPLRLHQIEYVSSGVVPSDLSSTLVMSRADVSRLQERIGELRTEKAQQRELGHHQREKHAQLTSSLRDAGAQVKELQERCQMLMVNRFERQVDLDALQTRALDDSNSSVLGLQQQLQRRAEDHAQEALLWEAKVQAARDALLEVTRCNTELLHMKNSLFCQRKELEDRINASRSDTDQGRPSYKEELCPLQKLKETQSQDIEALRKEIYILSRKGGSILPPLQAPVPNQVATNRRTSALEHLPVLGTDKCNK